MKRKWIVILSILFVFLLIFSVYSTYYVTSRFYKNRYQVNQWPYQNYLKVEKFYADTEVRERSIFSNTFPIHVEISGILQGYGNGYEPYIKDVQISERLETENEKIVAYLTVTPIVDMNLKKSVSDYKKSFEYKFDYRINTFQSSDVNKYIIKCGDKEQIVQVHQEK